MNWQVDLEVVYGSSQHNPAVLNGITQALRQAQITGTFYIGYPVMASSDSSLTVDALSDLCEGIEMCIDSPSRASDLVGLTMRTPMRFDFDPARESEDHPLVHLHTQFNDTRLSVQQAMCFPSFMKKVIRTFYRDEWALHPEIESLHEQSIEHEDGQCDPLAHCFQMSWI